MRTFVGRERELVELEAGLDDVRTGRGRLFLLAGEPGIGKTRLAEELVRRAEERGFVVAWGRSWEIDGAPPFWPWIQALRTIGRARPALLEVLVALEGASTNAWRDAVERRFQVFDAIATTLREAAEGTPITIVLDDLHWADPSSVALLHFLSRQLAGSAIYVLCTYRDREMRSSPSLGELLARVAREGTTLDLARFDAAELRTFVEQRSGSPIPDALLSVVVATTEGLPLFVDEVVRAMHVEGGAPEARKLTVPKTVHDAIHARLLLLDQAAREVLVCAAVLGREVDARTLEAMRRAGGSDASELPRALHDALAASVVVEAEQGVYRFSHALVREALYTQISPEARRTLHARAAACLTAIGAGDTSHAEIFAHLVEAGSASTAAEVATAAIVAARRAMAAYGFEDAAHLLERAVPALEERGAAPSDVAEALVLLGEARARSAKDATRPCLRAAEIARSIDDPDLFARAALALGAEIAPAVVSATLVELLSEASRRLPPAMSALRARVLARLSGALQPAKDPREPMRLAREAIAMARDLGERNTLLAVLIGAGSALVDLALPAERIEVDRDTLRLAQEAGDAPSAFRAHVRLFMDHVEIGTGQAAERSAAAVERLGRELRRSKLVWYACMMHASRALQAGELDRADALERRADEIASGTEDGELLGLGSLYRFARSLVRGEDIHLRESLGAYSAYSFGGDSGFGFEEVSAVFVLARTADPRAIEERLASVRRDIGFTTVDPVGMYMLSEALFRAGSAEGALTLRDHLESRRGLFLTFGATGFVALGPIEWLLARLASLAGAWSDAERDFESAVARCVEVGARPALVHVLIDRSIALERKGERTRAKEIRARAEALATELGLFELARRARGETEHVTAHGPSALVSALAFALERDGDGWRVTRGERTFHVKNTRGMGMLAELVAAPDVAVHVLLLGRGTEGGDRGDAGPMLDARAVRAYRDRLELLREQEREAEQLDDHAHLESVRTEIDALSRELARGLGLGGRQRRAASAVERARSNVQRRVKDAIRRVEEGDPELGQYLSWTVRTGTFCVFEPKIEHAKAK